MDDGTVRRSLAPDGRASGVAPDPDALELAWAALQATEALALVIGPDGRVLLANPAMTLSTGWTPQELAARPLWDVYVVPEDVAHAREAVGRSFTDGVASPQEGDWLDRWGGRRRVSMVNTVVRGSDGCVRALVTLGRDVTEQRRAEEALRRQAQTDSLTGVLNRRAVLERLSTFLTDPSVGGCGVLFCDLDGFKRTNDTYGHHVGDELLVETATRLGKIAGVHDVVARLGGDEFIVLCPGADQDRLDTFAARITTELAHLLAEPDGAISIGVSVGAVLAVPGADAMDVMREADKRMYASKVARRRST